MSATDTATALSAGSPVPFTHAVKSIKFVQEGVNMLFKQSERMRSLAVSRKHLFGRGYTSWQDPSGLLKIRAGTILEVWHWQTLLQYIMWLLVPNALKGRRLHKGSEVCPSDLTLLKLASEVWIMKGVFSVSPKLDHNQTQSWGQGIVAARSYLIGRESWEASWAEYDK